MNLGLDYYILEPDNTVRQAKSSLEWAQWFERTENRLVGWTGAIRRMTMLRQGIG